MLREKIMLKGENKQKNDKDFTSKKFDTISGKLSRHTYDDPRVQQLPLKFTVKEPNSYIIPFNSVS